MLNPVTLAARALLAGVFVNGGISQLKAPDKLGPLVDKAKQQYGIDLPATGQQLVTLNGAGMVAAGSALALGIMPRASALALAGMLVPTNIVGHAFWEQDDPGKRAAHTSGFLSNAAIIGGLLMVAKDRARRRR